MSAIRQRWPLAVITGYLGSGKTTLIVKMLRNARLHDTIVVVNEFGEVGLDHHLLRRVTDDVVLLPNGCLCCVVKNDLVRTLRDIRQAWFAGNIGDFRRVIVETTGLAEPGPLVAELTRDPIVSELFELAAITTVVDAEHGLGQLHAGSTAVRQVCAADHIHVSKADRVAADLRSELEARIGRLNPAAAFVAEPLEERSFSPFRASLERRAPGMLGCESVEAHTERVRHVVLRPSGPLSWPRFQTALAGFLERHAARLLRLKGVLLFAEAPHPIVIQAVHDAFYPIASLDGDARPVSPFLVLIFDGAVPPEAEQLVSDAP